MIGLSLIYLLILSVPLLYFFKRSIPANHHCKKDSINSRSFILTSISRYNQSTDSFQTKKSQQQMEDYMGSQRSSLTCVRCGLGFVQYPPEAYVNSRTSARSIRYIAYNENNTHRRCTSILCNCGGIS